MGPSVITGPGRDARWQVMAAMHALADDSMHTELRGLGDVDWALSELFDSLGVLGDPEAASGYLLYSDEVSAFRRLGDLLVQMIEDLGGNAPDEVYVSDPRWAKVVLWAREILEEMFQRPPDGELGRREFPLPPRSES